MLSRGRYAAFFLILAFLLLFSLNAGCSSKGSQPGGTGGLAPNPGSSASSIQDITSRNPPKISLENATDSLTVAEQDGGIDITGMSIHQVFGYGVDSSGLARTWVLGMQGGGKTTLLSYTAGEGEWKSLDMSTIVLPVSEVVMNDLMSPQDLFQKNSDLIVRAMNKVRVDEADLSLADGSYQVTIHSQTDSMTLVFNGKTGEKE